MTTGQLIANLLDERNITQRELSEAVGVSEVTISRYVNGTRQPKSDILFRIAKALNVTTDYFNTTSQDAIIKNTKASYLPSKFEELDIEHQEQLIELVQMLIENTDSYDGVIMFLKLDVRDQGKIENAIETMLKADKYLKKGQELA